MADYAISYADLSGIRNELSSIERELAAQGQLTSQVYNRVNGIENELEELKREFESFMASQEREMVITRATTELVRVRQEIEEKFGNYRMIRETMVGVLQATDKALVTKNTISRISEELMISAPDYWLAPCLIAVAAWIGNDQDLANRAIKEAVRRDEGRTALTMALVCRRNGRTDTCYEWLSIYFAKLDARHFTEANYAFVDAYVNGIFGEDVHHLCDDYLDKWMNEIKSEDGNFDTHQMEHWNVECRNYKADISADYTLLKKHAKQYKEIDDYVGRIVSVNSIKEQFHGITGATVDSDELKAVIDHKLMELIEKYDVKEEGLRRDELYYTELKRTGDEYKAELVLKKLDEEYHEKTVDFFAQMNRALDSNSRDIPVSQKKTALKFMSQYVNKGFENYMDEKKTSFPKAIDLDVDTWTGATENGSNKDELLESYVKHMNDERANEVEKQKSNLPKVLFGSAVGSAVLAALSAVIGVICLIINVIINISGGNGKLGFVVGLFIFFAIVLGIVAISCFVGKVSKDGAIKRAITRVNEEYDTKIANGQETITGCIEEWNNVVGVVAAYEEDPVKKIIA